jgi:hypothetical protein
MKPACIISEWFGEKEKKLNKPRKSNSSRKAIIVSQV